MKELLASGNGMDGELRGRTWAAVEKKAIACRRRVIRSVVLLCLTSLFGVSGCYTPWSGDASDPIVDNTRFMNAWQTYRHCSSSSEPDEIWTDLQELRSIALMVMLQTQPSAHLPAAIRSWMDALPSRLAVDPNAMTTACALHGAHLAQFAGRSELSAELFTAAGAAREGLSYVRYAGGLNRMLKRR
jgi:hypothetical protein